MNEQDIKDFIQQCFQDNLGALKQEILETVDQKNQGLASNISKKLKSFEGTKPPQEDTEQSLAQQTLEQRIKQLETDLQEKEHKALVADRDSKISDLIAGSQNIQSNTILSRQLKALYGDRLIREDGKWYVRDGENQVKDFDSVYKEYLTSEEGSFFLKPSSVQGTNSKTTTVDTTVDPPSKDDLVLSAFEAI